MESRLKIETMIKYEDITIKYEKVFPDSYLVTAYNVKNVRGLKISLKFTIKTVENFGIPWICNYAKERYIKEINKRSMYLGLLNKYNSK